jgi:hypothetical protein
LIGAARSGTTLLGEQLLSSFPEVNYVGEKNWVWKYGNVYRHTDQLDSKMLSNKEKQYIIDRFDYFSRKGNRPVLIEKTPSNTLRLPLLIDLFPSAKFIFIFRDGAEVARSASLEWAGISSKALDSKKVRQASPIKRVLLLFQRESDLSDRAFNFTELTEIPYYFYRFLRNFIKINLKIKSFPWGPMNREIDHFRKKNSLLLSCAYQWKICTESMLEAAKGLSVEKRLLLHFDELKSNPGDVLKKIAVFLSLPSNERLIETLETKVKCNFRSKPNEEKDLQEITSPVNAAVEEVLNDY